MRIRTQLALGLAATLAVGSLTDPAHDAPEATAVDRAMRLAVIEALPAEVTSEEDLERFASALRDAHPNDRIAWSPVETEQPARAVDETGATPIRTTTAASRGPARMSPAVAALAAAGGADRVDIIVGYDALPPAAELGALDARLKRDFPHLNMAQVNVPAASLSAFSVRPGVSLMTLDAPLEAASHSSKRTARKPDANSPWNIPVASDVRIAVLDSGVSALPSVNVAARMDCTAGWTGSTRNFRDDFTARVLDGNDGADAFSSSWIEHGESDGLSSGALEINNSYGVCLSGECMELEGYRSNVYFARSMDLDGASEATLTYVASVTPGGGAAAVEISADGNTWHTLASYTYGAAITNATETFDITPFASASTTLRMRVTQHVAKDDMGVLGIDNVRIDASIPQEQCVVAAPQPSVFGGNLLDTFDHETFASNNGSISFASDWQEVGESNGPTTGDLEVDDDSGLCVSGRCMQIETVTVGDALVRGANLAGAGGAKVNYVYSHTNGGAVAFEVSADGGYTWSTLATHDMSQSASDIAASVDVTPWLSDDMRVRFRVAQANAWGKIGIDDFEIQVNAADVDAYDEFGHGTHVAGIIGGVESGVVAGDGGVAPNAGIVSVRVLDGEGRGITSDVLAGLDWIIANAATHNIRVVNLSLGKAVTESASIDPLVAAAEAVWDAGIVVVASAGNYGRDGHFTITSPGNSPKLITVGSLTDSGSDDFADDYVSTYSSRGPTALDNYLKPDLVAPGNAIVSTSSGSSKMAKDLPSHVLGHERLELSGTSMAAAMTSGAAALMLSADPNLTPATVKARLMRSARKVSEDPTVVGAGVLDIEAALAETGVMAGEALSPRMARSSQNGVVLVENTAQLWGDATWGAGYLWTDGDKWAQGYLWSDEDVSFNGFLWSDEGLQSNGFLWTDGSTWANGYLWSDEGLWANGFLWADEVQDTRPLFTSGALDVTLDDD